MYKYVHIHIWYMHELCGVVVTGHDLWTRDRRRARPPAALRSACPARRAVALPYQSWPTESVFAAVYLYTYVSSMSSVA